MSARFAELMAMSAAQTRDSVAATQQILEEKKKKDEQRRKEQEERERREREIQARLIKKRMEEEQRAEERKRKAQEERERKEQLTQQREEEKRKNLVFGKDRRSGFSSSGGGGRGRKSHADGDEDDDGGSIPLTREEKRQRRLNADLNKSFTSIRKNYSSPSSHPVKKSSKTPNGNDLPRPSAYRPSETHLAQSSGGGINVDSGASISSVRKQLDSMPALVRLGTTKRDVRTVDEIMADLHKKKEGKVLEGDEARKNGDWFGENKKRKAASVPSSSPAPEAIPSQSSRAGSREPKLAPKQSMPALIRGNDTGSQTTERKEPRTKVTVIKPETGGSISFTKTNKVGTSTSVKASVSGKSTGLQPARASLNNGKSASSAYKKRARSESFSDSDSLDSPPPTAKRRSSRNDISSEIWKLFGKDRDRYVQNDVYSDEDDDMEADADALRREEARSARIAKREDELAAEEEKRHEEEKRRKRKERERLVY